MSFSRYLLLPAIGLFCLTCLVACRNYESADQLTVVQGTVTSYETGRPLPGVLLAMYGYENSFSGWVNANLTSDSVRTDAQGHYQLSFRNRKGLFYAVVLAPHRFDLPSPPPRLAFAADQPVDNFEGSGGVPVVIGRTNAVDFRPNELRTVAVRIHNRNTGYQRLDLFNRRLRGTGLDTLVYASGLYLPPTGVKVHYYKLDAAKQVTKDTLVALVLQNPAALPPDTLRATLTFVR